MPDHAVASAVLVCLFERSGDTHVILTRRSWHLRQHAGQVSFPGGRDEPGDVDLAATAAREAQEEIDLNPDCIKPVAELDSITTVSGVSLIVPFVVSAAAPPSLVANPSEVDTILEVPFSELLSPVVWREEVWSIGAHEVPMRFFELIGDTVWGATAVLLRQLLGIAIGMDRAEVAPSSRRWRDVARGVEADPMSEPDPL